MVKQIYTSLKNMSKSSHILESFLKIILFWVKTPKTFNWGLRQRAT